MRQRWGEPIALAASGIAITILLVPLGLAVRMSFQEGELLGVGGGWSLAWYGELLQDPVWLAGLRQSLWVAVASASLAVVVGVPGVMGLARLSRAWERWALAAMLLPLFIPSVALGMGMLIAMRGLGLWGTTASLILAHACLSLPIVVLVVRSAYGGRIRQLEEAAAGLGAHPATCFVRITLPLLAPAITIAALLAFILSLNEFLVALFLATPDIETLPKIIWPNLRYTLSPIVASASTLLIVATIVMTGILFAYMRRISRKDHLPPSQRGPSSAA